MELKCNKVFMGYTSCKFYPIITLSRNIFVLTFNIIAVNKIKIAFFGDLCIEFIIRFYNNFIPATEENLRTIRLSAYDNQQSALYALIGTGTVSIGIWL